MAVASVGLSRRWSLCSQGRDVYVVDVASVDATSAAKAAALLENVRRTPLAHGRLRDAKAALRWNIARTIEDGGGVPQRLADRIAFQLVFKFGPAAVGDVHTWRALGVLLRRDVDRLKDHVGLVERQIVVALPKLSAQQIEDLLEELRAADPAIARTILNTALDAADPVRGARRYLAEFHAVVRELSNIDPRIARTFANATFMAHAPREKALSHFKRFADLMTRFRDDVDFVRTVARAACRAVDPLEAAQAFIAKHDAVVAELTSTGVESSIARSLAAIASLAGEPLAVARKLLQNFEAVLALAKQTHPQIARSIALSACRASEPLQTARLYMNNYDTILRAIGHTDPRRASHVASQAFRSDNPLRWAKRYLAQLHGARTQVSIPSSD
jgi:hypothetical protein